MKKGLDLGGMIDTSSTPKNTGVPQRGAEPLPIPKKRQREERRADQMSIRMKPSIRERIETMAEAEDIPIAHLIERAILAYKP